MNDLEYAQAQAAAYRNAFEDLSALVSFSNMSDEARKAAAAKIESDLTAKLKALREAN